MDGGSKEKVFKATRVVSPARGYVKVIAPRNREHSTNEGRSASLVFSYNFYLVCDDWWIFQQSKMLMGVTLIHIVLCEEFFCVPQEIVQQS